MTGIVDFRTELLDENGAPITATNPLPTTGGGGGAGSALSDTVFQDSTGQLFVYRDSGTGTPTAYSIPTWAVYVPTDPVTAPTVTVTSDAEQDMLLLLTRMLTYLNAPQGYDKSLQRQRGTIVVESGTVTTVSSVTTVSTVSTVTTVAGLTNIDGRNGSMLINQTNLSAWADCVRSRIT